MPFTDATSASKSSRSSRPRLAPALQQVHLHEVDGVDVRVAQPDRALQRRLRVEQPRAALHRQDVLDGEVELAPDRGPEALVRRAARAGRRTRRCPCRPCASTISTSSSKVAKNGQRAYISPSSSGPKRSIDRAEAAADAEPARQHVAALRPGEHPGHGAQRLDAAAGGARHRPRADLHALDHVDGRDGLEVVEERGSSYTSARYGRRLAAASTRPAPRASAGPHGSGRLAGRGQRHARSRRARSCAARSAAVRSAR